MLLRQEHQALLDLFRRQREPAELANGRAALQGAIAELLDAIRHVEREVFFPALPSEYEALVQAFLADQRVLEQCLANLQRNAASASGASLAGDRLELLVREHLAREEQWLFAAVEREHPLLNAALYDRLVEARSTAASRPG